MIEVRQSATRTTAHQFRTWLYVASLLLVGLLVYLGLRLRARTLGLRRRAAFEHIIAGISMRFIDTAPGDFEGSVEQALADMAEHFGSDRAYLLFSGTSTRAYKWRGSGVEFPPGWPELAPALVARLRPGAEGTVHIPRVNRLPPGEIRNSLAAVGSRSWACVMRVNGNDANVLLGFDAIGRQSRITRFGELGLLRMALDAVANAIRRQALEVERARLETRVRQARHLEAVGRFASGIAHNFNNIVGAILGYTEIAGEQSAADHQSTRVFEEIRRAGERARELVNEILTFAKRRVSIRQPLDVRALIAEATSLLRASLPATVEIVVRGTPEAVIVSATLAQLQQAIMNLCANAAQAMDYSGRVGIETAIVVSEVRPKRSLSHGELSPGTYVRIKVDDAGPGMDDSILERIFEPFFTTRVDGSGLGLATVREIVREHGGAIDVRSAVGVGTCFEVWLPRVAVAVSIDGPGGGGSNDVRLPLGRGETALVIEDDSELRRKNEEVLAALGYEPVGFSRASEARSAIRETPERFDVVLIGNLGSAAAALDLAASLHKVVPRIPILLVTAPADEIDADSLMVAGVADVVGWPINASEVAAVLAACLEPNRSAGSARLASTHEAYSSWSTKRHA